MVWCRIDSKEQLFLLKMHSKKWLTNFEGTLVKGTSYPDFSSSKLSIIYLRVSHFRVNSFNSFVSPEGVERVSIDGEAAGQVDFHHRHVAGSGGTALDVIGAYCNLQKKFSDVTLSSNLSFFNLLLSFLLSKCCCAIWRKGRWKCENSI